MRIVLLASAALLTLSTHAADAFRIEKNVAYLAPDRTEKADLYVPVNSPAGARRPAVVIIHGGGWTGGDKGAGREMNIGTNLALNGYVGMSINYVLASTNKAVSKATWPQNLHDCMTAVRWLRKHAERLQVDPERIGVIGGSAGGHLAAMLAVTGEKDGLDPQGPYGEFSCRVQCAVDLYGPADLSDRAHINMLGKSREEASDLYRAASPVTWSSARLRRSTPNRCTSSCSACRRSLGSTVSAKNAPCSTAYRSRSSNWRASATSCGLGD